MTTYPAVTRSVEAVVGERGAVECGTEAGEVEDLDPLVKARWDASLASGLVMPASIEVACACRSDSMRGGSGGRWRRTRHPRSPAPSCVRALRPQRRDVSVGCKGRRSRRWQLERRRHLRRDERARRCQPRCGRWCRRRKGSQDDGEALHGTGACRGSPAAGSPHSPGGIELSGIVRPVVAIECSEPREYKVGLVI